MPLRAWQDVVFAARADRGPGRALVFPLLERGERDFFLVAMMVLFNSRNL